MKQIDSEITVIGAGPAGSAVSYLLCKAGYEVLLLDKATFPRIKPCGDAVSPLAASLLEKLGLGQWLKNYMRIDGMRFFFNKKEAFWANIEVLDEDFDAGYIVPRFDLDNKLLEKAKNKGVEVIFGARVKGQAGKDSQVLAVKDGQILRVNSKLFILATGSLSKIGEKLGFQTEGGKGIAIRGYYGNIKGLDNLINILIDYDYLGGYGWVFPQGKDKANIGMGFLSGKFKVADLRSNLQGIISHNRFGALDFSKITCEQRPAGSILRMNYGKRPLYKGKFICIGDCAGLISPLTGEGISHALESAYILASVFANRKLFNRKVETLYRNYDVLLKRRFYQYFFFSRIVQRFLSNKKIVFKFMQAAQRDINLAHAFIAVFANIIPPRALFNPRRLFQIMK